MGVVNNLGIDMGVQPNVCLKSESAKVSIITVY